MKNFGEVERRVNHYIKFEGLDKDDIIDLLCEFIAEQDNNEEFHNWMASKVQDY